MSVEAIKEKLFGIRIDRETAKQYGWEAKRIGEEGSYVAPSGRSVDISAMVRKAVDGTTTYPPDSRQPDKATGPMPPGVEILNDTTLSGFRRLQEGGCNPVALNFASATGAGGGWLGGSRAQEEYLARSSTLFESLKDNPMYSYHRGRHDRLYSDWVIYSPEVPVFRGDDGVLLEEPYTASMLTSPAVRNSGLTPEQSARVEEVMRQRIRKVLIVGAMHGHDSIVLGAWGCGAFHNDPAMIARLFKEALTGDLQGAYRHVVFAITDWSEERKFIGPFEETFS
ncbi:MAG: TIGR02452 family protein [Acidobacteria bacterium]|uniref:TIGR02452 family protein n=1 Tax=Candidatus Polarisedimenticola svalbardensis TaxID=2886004 RepID=A0A8J6Y8V4_9BACT|nr:TIGR02452 family protein [Candidatus Polarisedimenticola svalbardensis]